MFYEHQTSTDGREKSLVILVYRNNLRRKDETQYHRFIFNLYQFSPFGFVESYAF